VELPPEDRPDTVDIGPIKGIPIFHDDDPRLTEERAAWSAARRSAQTLHTPDELIAGMSDPDWRVRHETVDRLIARGRGDDRTLPVLLNAATTDEAWQVRDAVVMRLHEFDRDAVLLVLREAENDGVGDVRWSARYSLFQMGLGPHPGSSQGDQ
jgi:HEAT repeat protein